MHTHSHYLLFLIGLRHCRKLVPKICQPASPQMFQKENQVSITRFTSLARGDRSADQCLLSAAGSSTKGKWSLSTGPNSCQVCTSLGRPGLASELPRQPRQLREISLLQPPAFTPKGSVGTPQTQTPVSPRVPLGQPHTTGTRAKTCLTPEPQWHATQNAQAHGQSPRAPHKSPSTLLFSLPHQPHL